ncbi:hypothetical protein HCG60_05145 [Ligilactobacillus murinus]|uniref:hypothetical protein n=1 Tax=Lactobacillaceae TaxID=33958 RepID=UPI001C8CF006|nr:MULTISPECIES: hypothetical protein [Lactobacillaceae]MBX9012413.1 hypothetical protein [Ligilactobacillus murinus]
MKLNNEQLLGLRRLKGEMNITITALSNEIGLSRWTLANALKGKSLSSKNVKIINDWLLKQYVK